MDNVVTYGICKGFGKYNFHRPLEAAGADEVVKGRLGCVVGGVQYVTFYAAVYKLSQWVLLLYEMQLYCIAYRDVGRKKFGGFAFWDLH